MKLRVEKLSFAYAAAQPVLREVNLELLPGRVTMLFGPNGCGKSTLLRCLNGTLRPQAGRVLLDDRPLCAMSRREIAQQIAVVPQDTPADVPFTVTEMVRLGRYAHPETAPASAAENVILAASLERAGIASLAARRCDQLSGGERQRVVIARALAQQGRVLLMDEPATHLDITHQLEVYGLARALAAEGQLVLMVCHDLLLAPLFADDCVLMVTGELLAHGPADVALAPENLRRAYGCAVAIRWETAAIAIHAQFSRP